MHTHSRRRWRHRTATLATDGIVWAAYFFITAAVLLAGCLILTMLWPTQ